MKLENMKDSKSFGSNALSVQVRPPAPISDRSTTNKMKNKTKKINLSICIPNAYKYQITQPWGEIVLFKRKPKWIPPFDGNAGMWGVQPDEIIIGLPEKVNDLNRPDLSTETLKII